jgi:hypothetical protein
MTTLSICTSLSCLTDCWVCVAVAGLVGGFLGVMIMAMCIAARDADDRAGRFDLDEDCLPPNARRPDNANATATAVDDDDDGKGNERDKTKVH